MQIPAELWDLIKMVAGAYFVFVLNKTDRNQHELFKRIRSMELSCAKNHGKIPGGKDED